MLNYIKAVREYLEDDVEMQAFTSNIHFLVVPKEKSSRPLIVFSEIGKANPYSGEGGRDIFEVLFETVVDLPKAVDGRRMRELLKKKFSAFNGILTADRKGNIAYMSDVNVIYDDQNNVVRYGVIFQFKAIRDLS